MRKPNVLTISSSLSPSSRSKVLAKYAHEELGRMEVESQFLDLADYDIQIYPRSENDPTLRRLVEVFERADGYVIASPVYNWHNAASVTNFLHYALDPEGGRRYRPFLLLAGAGSSRSHLACDGLTRTLTSEIHAIQIGPPIVGAGDEVDKETGWIDESLEQRIVKAISVLAEHAKVAYSLSMNAASIKA
jgi:FMN reductase